MPLRAASVLSTPLGALAVDLARFQPGPGNTGVPGGTTLTPSSTTSANRRDITTSNQTFDSIDFTNIRVVLVDGVHDITFTRCRFAMTDPGLPFTAHYVQAIGSATNITFDRCTFDGATPDPYKPIGIPVSPGSGATFYNLTVHGCEIVGFNDSWNWKFMDGVLFERNWLHGNIVDKSADTTPDKSNPGVWGHADATQVGATNFVRDILCRANRFSCVCADGTVGNAILQIGAMTGTPQIENFLFYDNWCHGGQYMFNANLNPPITVVGGLEFRRNRISPDDLSYSVKAPAFTSLITAWDGNRWDSGVSAGQLIPF